jgi:hypothetical protein
VVDIERAYDEGALALLPRLCCAKAVRADPAVLHTYAALGYRWIAPWSSGVPRPPESWTVGPVVAAARSLKVILDVADLPESDHAKLRAALGDRRALFLTYGPATGKDLGPQTLPLVRFRQGTTWEGALDAFPGMATPVVYVPKADRLAAAIATWGATQPAGWDQPGSPQRRAIRAALGGRLVEWLSGAE